MEFHGRTPVYGPPAKCAFPGCDKWAEHRHHITYQPEVTCRLCDPHHQEITILNGQQARKCRHTLSNKHRWWIWNRWIKGQKNVRRTQRSLEWINQWQDRPMHQEVIVATDASARIESKNHATPERTQVSQAHDGKRKRVRGRSLLPKKSVEMSHNRSGAIRKI
jgi:hypothetical protein